MTPANHLHAIASHNVHDIEHVTAIREHIKTLENAIELKDAEISRLNKHVWDKTSLLRLG